MTTITLEVPDELAARLEPWRDQMPALLYQALDSWLTESKIRTTGAALTHPVFKEMIEFLASSPTPKQLIAHQASLPMQERLEELLDKNREEGLTDAESAELDAFELVDDVMILLKAHARLAQPRPQ
jgi:hypothetical protein